MNVCSYVQEGAWLGAWTSARSTAPRRDDAVAGDASPPADVLDHCDIAAVHPQTVVVVRKSLIEQREATRVAEVFKVLGDPSRCRLVYALLAAGEICVCDLAAALDMSESNVSHHLRVLRAHSLVRPRRQGKMVFYAPDDEHISLLLDLTREHVTHARGGGTAAASPAETRPEAGR
jgi:DNA-binding transcriptional ArsR family regulator